MSKVLIDFADYDTCRSAVDRAMEVFPQKISGRRVLIKPNVLRTSCPDDGIITHPALVRAVVEAVEEQQPESIVVGDNPGLFHYGDNERCFVETGLMEAAKGYYQNIGNDSLQVAFNPSFMSRICISRAVFEADVIISLPKFKTHGLTVVTGAIKNSYGILPGALKARLHKAAGSPERFHEAVVEVFRLRVPDLFIMDAVLGMEGNGPASADLRRIGRIMASDNAVALDAVVARMMGLDPGRLRFLQKAEELVLGNYSIKSIEFVGKFEEIPNFKLPPLGGEALLQNETTQDMLRTRSRVKPAADPNLCTGCGDCIEHCPVQALSMDGSQVPVVDTDTCITCFCCQELCPEKAMALR